MLSLGSCTLIRIPVVMGYIGGVSSSRKSSHRLIIAFIVGLVLGYTFYGILLGYITSLAKNVLVSSTVIFYLLGAGLIIISLHLLGFLWPHSEAQTCRTDKFSDKYIARLGVWGAFLFGIIFVIFEAPACPCCGPVIFAMAAYTFSKGKVIYGISLFFVYALGQSLPLLLIGFSAGAMKFISSRIEYWEEVINVFAGVILFCLGSYFLWLA